MVVALVLLLLVFLAVIVAIAAFVFPPTRWVELAYKSGRRPVKTPKEEPK
jgi:hypothetical protein